MHMVPCSRCRTEEFVRHTMRNVGMKWPREVREAAIMGAVAKIRAEGIGG
jgi:hypothetical protein